MRLVIPWILANALIMALTATASKMWFVRSNIRLHRAFGFAISDEQEDAFLADVRKQTHQRLILLVLANGLFIWLGIKSLM